MVYLQNSGLGNTINLVIGKSRSLWNTDAYITWVRGEPGVEDEPQHVYQGIMTICWIQCSTINNIKRQFRRGSHTDKECITICKITIWSSSIDCSKRHV